MIESSRSLPDSPSVPYPFFPSLSSIPELASTWPRTINVVDGFPIFLLVFSRAVSVSSIDGRHKRKATISFNVAGYLFSNDLPLVIPPTLLSRLETIRLFIFTVLPRELKSLVYDEPI